MQKGKEPKITRSNDISFDRPRNRAHSGAYQGSSQRDSETFNIPLPPKKNHQDSSTPVPPLCFSEPGSVVSGNTDWSWYKVHEELRMESGRVV